MKDSKAEILDFWFVETSPVQWFQKNDVFDDMIRERFLPLYDMAKDGFCDGWMQEADGYLALCILLDQFPRNMFRDTAQAFETDAKALDVANRAIALGLDLVIPQVRRRFIYLPFEHSEKGEDQDRSVKLFESMKEDDPLSYEYAIRHARIIETYGRFPHRNKALDRQNTSAEIEYLSQAGAGF